MGNALIISSVIQALLVGGLFLSNLYRRGWDVVSLRNCFLVGYVHFMCLGAVFLVRGIGDGTFRLDSGYLPSDRGMLLLAILGPLFLLVFLSSSAVGFRWSSATRVLPKVDAGVNVPVLVCGILGLLFLSAAFSLLPQTGYVGLLGSQFASGAAAGAFGLAVYYVLSQRMSPFAWGLLAATLVIGAVSTAVHGSGRRFFLGLLLAGPWVLYFAKLRYARPAKLGVWMLAGGAAAMFALLVYSNIRSEEQRDAASRARQLLEAVVNPRIDLRNISYMLYTDTAYNTMFILENYPERFGYQPLHGAWWVATNPIPRAIWAGKPAALGETLRDQMDSNANLGAGIVGQAWSEAGVLGVLYYAAFFGILLGIVDRALAERATNPYFVVAIGASLGNMIAMARGDVGLFFIQVVASAVAVFAVLWTVKLAVGPIGRAFPDIQILPVGFSSVGEIGVAGGFPLEEEDRVVPESGAAA